MGSLRNPIGPLPSSIYWRRRAVALGLLGLLILLGLWFVTLGGDGGSGGDQGKGSDGKGPGDTTITPGPVPSGPHYSQRPGGRGDSGTGGTGGGGTGGSGGSGGSGGDHSGAGGSGGAGSGGSGTGGSGGGALGTGDSKTVPAGSKLPDCASGSVRVELRSVKNAYAPDEKPKFEVVVKNTGGSACKVNLGATAAILKITSGDDHVWSSDDCARGAGAVLVELPGSGETKRTVEWDRKRSAPQCATPSGDTAAGAGTYRVEVKIAGVTERLEFSLEK
ncbi:hypothetical protein [Streptomyces sp. ISL-11]|uniref:hypothetical protein n=1 Tax=Streptomyces sp. ISL-11 TaxID=2819174 RepID=UPI001BEC9F19|nr:hypothetical protein [Streptomyces sp. ISL-11]MBT2382691.1 hypothetical protein [Streptomyces sp. ISL-11]